MVAEGLQICIVATVQVGVIFNMVERGVITLRHSRES